MDKQLEKKKYVKPEVKTEEVKLGVFGQYGGSGPVETKGFINMTWSWVTGAKK